MTPALDRRVCLLAALLLTLSTAWAAAAQRPNRPYRQPAPTAAQPATSNLPPTPPTQAVSPAVAPPAAVAATQAPPAETPARNAEVSFQHGQLAVRADNSSLNEILGAISARTGLKIVGGVTDQRVFGSYGPAEPAVVLATLLDGTGVNMLYRGGDSGMAPELILTQRNGGPSPPSPVAYAPPPPPQPEPPPAQQPIENAQQTIESAQQPMPQPSSIPTDPAAQPQTNTQFTDAQSGTSATNGQAPTGPLTPEQVMQQLLKLQQQQQTSTTGH